MPGGCIRRPGNFEQIDKGICWCCDGWGVESNVYGRAKVI